MIFIFVLGQIHDVKVYDNGQSDTDDQNADPNFDFCRAKFVKWMCPTLTLEPVISIIVSGF